MYEPTATDVAWVRWVLRVVTDGGVLVFPGTRLIFSVSHQTKSLTLINPEVLEDKESAETYAMTQTVFNKEGYIVTVH